MPRFNKQKLIKIAKQNGIILHGLPVRYNRMSVGGGQRIYDFDVSGDTNIKRIKIVYYSNQKTIKNFANVYLSSSTKRSIHYNSYTDLINQMKKM